MPSFVVRVWVPDRPGALGAVASRIGAVHGDLVGIDILERGAGRAIDELVVDLPEEGLVPLLISEIGEVDGVDVEDVRPASAGFVDPRLDALESAAFLVERFDVADLLEALAGRSTRDLQADWAAVLNLTAVAPMVTVGDAPPAPWLQAFVAGSRSAVPTGDDRGPDDVAWAEMASVDVDAVIVLGRRGRPFRARERRQLGALARIADHRWEELAARQPLVHPGNQA
ncbi:MAG: hypothetical protein M3063_10395 [Actinomycetota bacterium]|nr:hypothetical protein [Actinomycetota bacterium]